jgi:hypothetical protein
VASLKRLFHVPLRSTLPRLRHHLTTDRKLDEYDESVNLLLEGGLARNWRNASRMVKASKKTPQQLFWELSKEYRPNWRRRLRFWAIGLIGAYTHDPHARELRELNERREK